MSGADNLGPMFLAHTNAAGTTVTPPMFMTADEVIQHHRAGDFMGAGRDFATQNKPVDATKPDGPTQKDRIFENKLASGRSSSRSRTWHASVGGQQEGVGKSIEKHGYDWGKGGDVRTHVFVDPTHEMGPSVLDGHHRIAAMKEHRPDEFIPTSVFIKNPKK